MSISFVGGGVMAEAIIQGILKAGIASPEELIVTEPLQQRRSYLESKLGLKAFANNDSVLNDDGLIILAVKPQSLQHIFEDLNGRIDSKRGVASIIAGVGSETIKDGLAHRAVMRIMPNTPAQISKGMTVWTASPEVSESDKAIVLNILDTLGDEFYVEDEKFIDMATALSASGPAYIFLFLEALIDAGVYLGMPREMARKLVLKTVSGSTELVVQSGKHPAELKDMVTSPAGTTIEALVSMENDGFRAAVINGVRAAYNRSEELGG
jgi:pyrroline-5-carboxylate reductase